MFIKFIDTNGKKRQVSKSPPPKTLEELFLIASKMFGDSHGPYHLAYLDSDGELITLTETEDWLVCQEELKCGL